MLEELTVHSYTLRCLDPRVGGDHRESNMGKGFALVTAVGSGEKIFDFLVHGNGAFSCISAHCFRP